MKLGVVYPQTELRGDPDALRTFALGLEERGFDYITAYDHVVGAVHSDREPPLTGPYTEHDPFHDPLMMFAFLSGITKRLEMVTGILILPQRQAVLAAKQILDLSLFSGDRFRLGVGTGWNWVEYRALGADYASRGRQLDEHVRLLRELWGGGIVDFKGVAQSVERATLVLRPRKPIPIWMGGFSDPAFRRAASIGDGFIFGGYPDPDPTHVERMRHFLESAGRSPDQFGHELIASGGGSAANLAGAIKRWRDQGHAYACIHTMGRGFAVVDQHLDFALEVQRLLE